VLATAAISLGTVPRRLASVRNAATPHLTVSFANSTGTFSIRSGTDLGSVFELQAGNWPGGPSARESLRFPGKKQFEVATFLGELSSGAESLIAKQSRARKCAVERSPCAVGTGNLAGPSPQRGDAQSLRASATKKWPAFTSGC